jgi:beta-glucosidase
VGWIRGYTDAWEENAFDAEDHDKGDIVLPFGQDELIKAVLKANPNTVVVMVGGAPVDMTAWISDAKGIIQAWYAGMEGGNALAEVLFGEINPSGKLPMTFPKSLKDSPAHAIGEYPGTDLTINYNEGIFVGYRYHDSYKVAPEFAFGHGLSYTTFDYSDLEIIQDGNTAKVKLKITNRGSVAGKEVVQLYVKDEESTLERPEKELKAFQKLMVNPGETKSVELELNEDAFKYYDDTKGAWVLEPGKFEILVGSASDDLRLTGSLEL